MTSKIRLVLFSLAYLIAGAILLAADAISRGGSWCGVLGMCFLAIGIILSVRTPLKRFFGFVFRSNDPS